MDERREQPLQPPRAPRRPVASTWHGQRLEDPYAWLRDPEWREAMREPSRLGEEIRAYLEAENDYTEAVLAPVAELRRRLYRELRGRIKEDDATVPAPDGPYCYFHRYRQGGQHPVLCRYARGADMGAAAILLDGDREAEGQPYFRLGAAEHSPDHRYLAYAVDTAGAEAYTIRIKDLESGELLAERLENTNGDFEWAADGRTLLYVTLDAEHRPQRVYRHRLGSDPGADPLVYDEPDPGFFVGVGQTESRRFLLVHSHDHTTDEVRVLPAERPEATPWLFAERRPGIEYEIADDGERWLILTNSDGAADYRIAWAPLEEPGAEWRDLVPHREGVLVQDMLLFAGHLVRLELEDALPRIVVRELASGRERTLGFDEPVYALGLVPGFEYRTTTLRFAYSSLTTPTRTYEEDLATGERWLRKEEEIPSGHDPEAYVAQRLHATGHGGEHVPISLFHRRDLRPDAGTPLLLHAYGAYGIIESPAFNPHRLSLVDRGFVYAIAHVRGGMERGKRWHEAGKLGRKPNTFRDYIACAEHLIATGYTGAGRICAQGGSAGGLLVGAVLNERPELFGAAVADVPFVDVLNTMLDPSLPLTPPEWPEWGNPIEDPEAFATIRGYSPYDNVRPQGYPPMLVTAGVSDPRVTYWEPAKWVARLRALRTDDNPLLLYTHMSAGHGGPGGRFERLEEVALRLAFVLWVFGRVE